MKHTTRIFASTFGAIMALAGIEHGIGEIFQGNVAPNGIMILSWPESEFFRGLGGEPAMTVIPNLLVTGSWLYSFPWLCSSGPSCSSTGSMAGGL